MKTKDAGIKKWLEQKGVDWRFIGDESERKEADISPVDAMLLRHKLALDARVKP